MKTVKLTFLGDISFSGKNGEATGPFIDQGIANVFKNADAVIGNFESSVTTEDGQTGLFQSKAESIKTLKSSGVTHAFLANNHVHDYGHKGFTATVGALEGQGLIPVGLRSHNGEDKRIVSFEHEGIKIGLMGCGWTKVRQEDQQTQYWEYDEEEIIALIQANVRYYDHLILVVHKGKMFVEYPSTQDRKAFKKYSELGVSAVICHHPHVIQGIEEQNSRLIAYSIGNFFFDSTEGHVQSSFSEEKQNLGIMVSLELSKDKLLSHKVTPVYKSGLKTTLLPLSQTDNFRKHLERISKRSSNSISNFVFFNLHFIRFVIPHFIKVKLHHLLKS